MSQSRDDILAAIRRSLASAHLPSARPTLPAPPYAPPAITDVPGMIDSFERELTPVKGKVHRAASAADAVARVLDLLKDCGGTDLLAWADDELLLPELPAALRAGGYRALDAAVPEDPAGHAAKLAELGRAVAGITGALAGLADTGTLVVSSSPKRPRLASLLPPVHIAILPAARLYPTQPAFWADQRESIAAGANLVFITGPSRTADIELIPTFGVHGPKQLHVVITP